jgi:FkbM family methyltransferase
VISVEPDPEMVAALTRRFQREIDAGRYEIAPVGLSDKTGEALLYGDNSGGGASVVPTKGDIDKSIARKIDLIDWTTFCARYDLGEAKLFVKINCEGAEIEIIDSIIAANTGNIVSMVVDFDIIKAPFGGWKKWSAIRRMKHAGLSFHLSEDVFVKHGARNHFENWLFSCEQFRDPPVPLQPRNLHQVLRIRWLEIASAFGVRDLLTFRKCR